MDYVKMAVDWDERAKEDGWKDRILTGAGPDFWPSGEREAEAMFKAAGLRPDNTVLDYGCGAGRVAMPMAKRCRVIGVDVSAEMLRRAFDACLSVQAKIPELQRVRHDGAIPIPSSTVDLAYEILVWQHIPFAHMPAVIEEVARCLRVGGRLLTMQPTGDDELDQRSRQAPATDTWVSRRYSMRTWERLMDEAGMAYVGELPTVPGRIFGMWHKCA